MFLDEKTVLEVWLNPRLNLTIFWRTGPWSFINCEEGRPFCWTVGIYGNLTLYVRPWRRKAVPSEILVKNIYIPDCTGQPCQLFCLVLPIPKRSLEYFHERSKAVTRLPQLGFIRLPTVAWVSGLPTGLGERRFFHFSPFPQKRLILRLANSGFLSRGCIITSTVVNKQFSLLKQGTIGIIFNA